MKNGNRAFMYLLVLLVVVLGVMFYKTNAKLQEAATIKSGSQPSIDEVRSGLSKAGIPVPSTMYDLTNGKSITEFFTATNKVPSYTSLSQMQNSGSQNNMPVTCMVYGPTGYITGWSEPNGSPGNYNWGSPYSGVVVHCDPSGI